ncbi:MAG TPA: hypothetical protein VJ875_01705 [Pyrinomonadaceae bacterium]|nr:hypothetical protein [Pyrinomonadaceae bacterium]
MYRFIVSCYYWPAGEARLRLRALIIKEQFAKKGNSLDTLASSIERRRMRRLKARCEIELVADLSLLDNDAEGLDAPLIFFGRTHDLNAAGLGIVLPSTTIDERFCSGTNRLTLSLFAADGPIRLEVCPVRCEPLIGPYSGKGYLLGAKITRVDNRDLFDRYLETLSDINQRMH